MRHDIVVGTRVLRSLLLLLLELLVCALAKTQIFDWILCVRARIGNVYAFGIMSSIFIRTDGAQHHPIFGVIHAEIIIVINE